jgi:hypothetical protein
LTGGQVLRSGFTVARSDTYSHSCHASISR